MLQWPPHRGAALYRIGQVSEEALIESLNSNLRDRVPQARVWPTRANTEAHRRDEGVPRHELVAPSDDSNHPFAERSFDRVGNGQELGLLIAPSVKRDAKRCARCIWAECYARP
jgi:hypothetical protein